MDKLIDMITKFLEADPISIVVWFFLFVMTICAIGLLMKVVLAAV